MKLEETGNHHNGDGLRMVASDLEAAKKHFTAGNLTVTVAHRAGVLRMNSNEFCGGPSRDGGLRHCTAACAARRNVELVLRTRDEARICSTGARYGFFAGAGIDPGLSGGGEVGGIM